MADVALFQKKLGDILTLAKINGKKITTEGVALFFKEDDLSETQLEKVFDYLRVQGIKVMGKEQEEIALKDPAEVFAKEAAPLNPEEEAYIKEYQKSLKAPGTGSILENRMWDVISAAKELHHGDIFIGDLIQEGNISLMMALEEMGEEISKETLMEAVRQGIRRAVEAQTQAKYQDDFLVERVRHLEESMRELADGVGEKSSIEELSAYLDMEEEEIRAVLRLTGDMDE